MFYLVSNSCNPFSVGFCFAGFQLLINNFKLRLIDTPLVELQSKKLSSVHFGKQTGTVKFNERKTHKYEKSIQQIQREVQRCVIGKPCLSPI